MTASRISRPAAEVLAEEEFRRFADLCADLTPAEWELPTDCAWWNVRKMVLHVLGSAEGQARFPELVHQLVQGMRMNKHLDEVNFWVDGMNELQIKEREHLTDAEIVAQLRAIGPKAVRGRWKTPWPMRYLPISFGPYVGWKPLKYLLDVGFTRDVWAHRIDLCTATGRSMELTAEHDGLLAADIADEWAALHHLSVDLELTGPAGGSYRYGAGGEHVEIDALEFVRILSGRRPGAGVLSNPLPL